MSDPPPSKTRPTWDAATIVLPAAKVSGSTAVACWPAGLVALVKVSTMTRVVGTAAHAGAARARAPPPASTPARTPRLAREDIVGMRQTPLGVQGPTQTWPTLLHPLSS